MRWSRFVLAVLIGLTSATGAAAQGTPAPAPKWEASIAVALLADHASNPRASAWQDDWSQSAAASLTIARFLGPHFHVGLDATIGGDAERYVQFRPEATGVPAFASFYGTEYRQSQTIGGVAGWQFGRNQWLHPYLRVGVGVARERVRTDIPRQSYVLPRSSASEPPVEIETTPARRLGPDTSFRVRGLLTAGVKVYLSERLSFRTDLQTIFRDRVDQLVLRAGLGIDF